MTQQDDITQRVLTDDEIMRSAISACDSLNITRFHEIGAPSKTIMDDAGLLELGRAIETAALSKLRAPVADASIKQALKLVDELRKSAFAKGVCPDSGACHHNCVSQCARQHELGCVPLGVSGLGDDWKLDIERGASAPVAGEAQPVAVTDHQGDVHWRHGRKAGIALYAAPQSSAEDVRNAALEDRDE